MNLRQYSAVICILLLTACGTARRGEPVAGPLTIASEKIANGEKVFMVNCHKCHPGGEGGLGLAINNKPFPAAMIRLQVRKGFGAMPAFPKEMLPDDQLDDLLSYLETLRKH